LASLIVADVEEILDAPFGEPSVVYYGYGGKRGMSLLQSKDSTKGDRTSEKRLLASKRGNRKKENTQPTTKKRNLTKEKTLLEYLNAINDPHLLTCLGLVRLDG
jgi:hypothetical protein